MKTVNIKYVLALVLAIAAAHWFIPPPGPATAQFTEQRTWGGTATGTANAITATIANYTSQVGVPLRIIAASPNTSATTANISGTGVRTIKRATSVGTADLVGGEWRTGDIITLIWDGTFYRLQGRFDEVGKPVDFRTTTVPAGYLAEDGSCVSRTATATAALFAAIGTTYGVCDNSTTFALPDSRGRLNAALDNQGSAGSAGRITNGGSSCTATTVGLGCGFEAWTLSEAMLPAINRATTRTQDATGANTRTTNAAAQFDYSTTGQYSVGAVQAIVAISQTGGNFTVQTLMTQPVFTFAMTQQAAYSFSFGSGQTHPVLNPIILGLRAIKL